MTLLDEAKQLRGEIAKLRPDKRRRYPDDLRRRILGWVERATDAGQLEHECSKAIGVKTWRFRMWRQQEVHAARLEANPLALVPVELPAMATSVGISLVAPSGYRVEGLSLEQLVALLRGLG